MGLWYASTYIFILIYILLVGCCIIHRLNLFYIDSSDPAVQSAFDKLKTRKTDAILQVPGSTYGGKFTLDWARQPRNVLIIKKQNDIRSENGLVEVCK